MLTSSPALEVLVMGAAKAMNAGVGGGDVVDVVLFGLGAVVVPSTQLVAGHGSPLCSHLCSLPGLPPTAARGMVARTGGRPSP